LIDGYLLIVAGSLARRVIIGGEKPLLDLLIIDLLGPAVAVP